MITRSEMMDEMTPSLFDLSMALMAGNKEEKEEAIILYAKDAADNGYEVEIEDGRITLRKSTNKYVDVSDREKEEILKQITNEAFSHIRKAEMEGMWVDKYGIFLDGYIRCYLHNIMKILGVRWHKIGKQESEDE